MNKIVLNTFSILIILLSFGFQASQADVLPIPHMNSSNECAHCHTYINGVITSNISVVDHNEVFGSCDGCHLSKYYTVAYHNTTHTVLNCVDCHNTTNWQPSSSAYRTCASCHNDSEAKGKSTEHISTTNYCEKCHFQHQWTPRNIDHSEVFGTCSSCHLATKYTTKSKSHPSSSDICSACHQTSTWIVNLVDHNEVWGTCSECHQDDSNRRLGHRSSYIMKSCETCHSTTAWKPATEVTNFHNNSGYDCYQCHGKLNFLNGEYIKFVPIDVAGITIFIPYKDETAVPPNPGPNNNLTLKGIDSDENNVRDDLQRFIEENYWNNKVLKRNAYRTAIFQTELINNSTTLDINNIKRITHNLDQLTLCLQHKFPKEYRNLMIDMTGESINTIERYRAVTKSLSLLGSDLRKSKYSLSDTSICE